MATRGLLLLAAAAGSQLDANAVKEPLPLTVTLNNGVVMPRVNLGTCCGSTPDAGLPSWLDAGGVGIGT
jgi:hypothetical protein